MCILLNRYKRIRVKTDRTARFWRSSRYHTDNGCWRCRRRLNQDIDVLSDTENQVYLRNLHTVNTAISFAQSTKQSIIMAALCNKGAIIFLPCDFLWPPYVIGGPLYFCPVISIFLLLFFPRLISAAAGWMSTIAANTGRKKVAKNRHLGTIAQLCRAIC